MGCETKLGLFGWLVGVVFIVLFGVILSDRAGSSVPEHAAMPVGGSDGHGLMRDTLRKTVDPFAALVVPGPDSGAPVTEVSQPVEESIPAPPKETAVEPAPKPVTEERGTMAFGPVIVDTPTDGVAGGVDTRIARADTPGERAVTEKAPVETIPTTDARTVHVVRLGETMTAIARHYYGRENENQWKRIFEANKTTLRDPARLSAGAKLLIPALPAEPAKTDAPKSDTPKRDMPRESARDSALADGTKPLTPRAKEETIREAFKGLAVPDTGKPAPVAKDPAKESVPKVTADDLGRTFGRQGDLDEQPARVGGTYTVQPGDTLYKIAEKLYGSSAKYGKLLYVRNQHLVSDPSRLKVGQKILLLGGVDTVAGDSAVATR